jgi:uncharacterized membrane protein YcjF (UPF0283 family)
MLKHPGTKTVPCPNCGTSLVSVRKRHSVIRLQLLAVIALIVAGADTPTTTTLPSLDQIANASPSFLLALGVMALVTGWLVPKYVNERSEARANAATTAAETAVKTGNDAVKAISDLSAGHKQEVSDLMNAHKQEIDDLKREIDKLATRLARKG